MKISVVIPTYNRPQLLPRAVESVLQQSSSVDEIIIIDDGSEPPCQPWLAQQFPSVTIIEQHNQGVSAARNTGIGVAQNDWIALLDSDDVWLPEKIAKIRQYHQQFPDIKLIHSEEIWIRDGIRVNAMNKHQKQGGWIFQHCLPLCVISPSAAVLHRSLFDQVGLFDENLPACEDYDLWLKICPTTEIGFIEQPLIQKFGGHSDQLSRKFWGMDRFRIRVLHRLLTQDKLNTNDAQATKTMLLKKLNILLKGAQKHGNQAVLDEFQPMLNSLMSETSPC